jgi:ribokinase
MTFQWDILGLGCVGIDELLYLSAFPAPDTKMPVDGIEQYGGGQTATALVAASRLGSRCAYGGALDDGDRSERVKTILQAEGIDLSPVVYRADAQPVYAIVLVDAAQHTRTILYDLSSHVGAADDAPLAETIRAAKILFVDQHGMKGNIRAAKIARDAGIPIVADLENDRFEGFYDLLPLIDHLILSADFAMQLTGATEPAEAARQLWTTERALVAVTCGASGAWYTSDGVTVAHQPAFPVDVVDTTGCGDVFHGAYASGLARGLSVPERIELGAAAAALKALKPGGQQGIPDLARAEAFIAERR